MNLYYDFHIHTALSPCCDDDMSPCNIVNMASIIGLDAIAITDHNSILNAQAAIEFARDMPLIVIPGMEIETAEEVHVVALFPSIEHAQKMYALVRESMPPIKNKPQIFGNQLIYDASDNVIGSEEQMLISACSLSIEEVFAHVAQIGGVCYPAHIDRSSNSVLANLGFIPPELNITRVELSKRVPDAQEYCRNKGLHGYNIMRSSDAHALDNIAEAENTIEAAAATIEDIFASLRS